MAATSASPASLHHVRTYAAHSSHPLRTAVLDPHNFTGLEQPQAFAMTRAAGATYARLGVNWRAIAPTTPPSGFVASDPTSPGYFWTHMDTIVSNAEAAGLTPILDIVSTPSWAYAKQPSGAKAGTPKTSELRAFATALATHFDGSSSAPAAHVFQVWNEPNNSLDISPVSGGAYRTMVNAVSAGVKGVSTANLVVAGGLDPFENSAERFYSTAPLAFMRSMLCLSKGAHPHATCHTQAHFDIWSHHPYTFGGPFGHARLADDVSLGDLPRMRALLKTAVKLHRIVSPHPIQFWVTEFGWDTNPPRPHAAPLGLEARWTSESLYQMWRSGISLVTWFLLEDEQSPSPYQSGLYFRNKTLADARPKPGLTAFRFPFVAYLKRGQVSIWGRDATSSAADVTIQRRHGSHGAWRTVARIKANRYGIFQAKLALSATKKDSLRATAPGSGKSLPFSLTVPKNQRYGPWGN